LLPDRNPRYPYEVNEPKFSQYQFSQLPGPHLTRGGAILRAHPELKKLCRNYPPSAFWVIGIVALQIFIALQTPGFNLWQMLLATFVVGAVANHALFVMIHECAHDLIFRRPTLNKLFSILANLPILFPAGIAFRRYHLYHHTRQGEYEFDTDLPGATEARLFGKNAFTKTIWLFCFSIFEGVVRPARMKSIKLWDAWTYFNCLVCGVFAWTMFQYAGFSALIYFALSTWFSVGLHPLGARWIQEHFVFREGQETFSYYGPLNRLMFNVGYHYEHHDLMVVPWAHLKTIRRAAPEFYQDLYAHHSYLRILKEFIFNPRMNLFSRVIRHASLSSVNSAHKRPASPMPTQLVQPLYAGLSEGSEKKSIQIH